MKKNYKRRLDQFRGTVMAVGWDKAEPWFRLLFPDTPLDESYTSCTSKAICTCPDDPSRPSGTHRSTCASANE